MKAMILAAGLGTRLRPATNHFAKPALPFLNIPLLYYAFALLDEAGATQYVVNAHYKPEQISNLLQTVKGLTTAPVISHEQPLPLGSGGGVWAARSYLEGDDFFLANGDEVILPKDLSILKTLRRKHFESNAISTILVMRHPGVGSQFGGVWADEDGRVAGFGKDASVFPGCTGYHYIGLQILKPRVFKYLKPGESNILYDALTAAITAGERVQVIVSDFAWFETGNVHDYLHASESCLHLLANTSAPLNAEVPAERDFLLKICKRFWPSFETRTSLMHGQGSLVEASSQNVAPLLLAGNGARVEPGAIIRGFAVLGENTIVESGACIERAVMLPNTRVAATESVKDAIITQ